MAAPAARKRTTTAKPPPRSKAAARPARATSVSQTDDEVYDIDAVLEAEGNLEPFPFKLHGEVAHLPHASVMTGRQMARMQAGLIEGVLLEVAKDDDLVQDLMDLPAFALQRTIQNWMRHAGFDPGDITASRT